MVSCVLSGWPAVIQQTHSLLIIQLFMIASHYSAHLYRAVRMDTVILQTQGLSIFDLLMFYFKSLSPGFVSERCGNRLSHGLLIILGTFYLYLLLVPI